MTLPGMLSRRAGRRAALCPDHLVCCSVATSNSNTSLAALATAAEEPSGVKATAVTVLPSCTDNHTSITLSICKFETTVRHRDTSSCVISEQLEKLRLVRD